MRFVLQILTVFFLIFQTGSSFAGLASQNSSLARLKGVKGPFIFAVIGDNRSGDRVYKKIIDQMMKREPLFVVNTGDVIPTAGDREEWANFWELSKPINVPYFLTPGNHEIDNKKSEQVWRDEVDLPGNELYYSFTVGRNLFIILDSCEPGMDMRIMGDQLEWLKRTLDPKKYEYQFVFLHHPLFLPANADHEGQSLDRYEKLRDELHRLFAEKGVTAVFAGHEHTFWRTEKDGVDYVITGGAGAPLYGKESFGHFVIINVDGPRIFVKAIDKEGTLRKEFIIRKEAGAS